MSRRVSFALMDPHEHPSKYLPATLSLEELLARASVARGELVGRLETEGTDAWRLFHGATEGRSGLTLDRYGPLVLAQTFREPLTGAEVAVLEHHAHAVLGASAHFVWNHRGKAQDETFEHWHAPDPRALEPLVCREFGVEYLVLARHRGLDPYLFLDLRAGRRLVRELAPERSVLNLFAYTGSAGVLAAHAGAREVWNVDFAAASLEIGRANAVRNGIPAERVRAVSSDCIPILRQLAGLPIKGRGASRPYTRVERRSFDVIVLDPPTFAKGPFGAVDIQRDYESLFKPALLALAPGGALIATNHAADVPAEVWLERLRRAAEKAGRPLASLELIPPEADFPSFDGRWPLKIALVRV